MVHWYHHHHDGTSTEAEPPLFSVLLCNGPLGYVPLVFMLRLWVKDEPFTLSPLWGGHEWRGSPFTLFSSLFWILMSYSDSIKSVVACWVWNSINYFFLLKPTFFFFCVVWTNWLVWTKKCTSVSTKSRPNITKEKYKPNRGL